ncbi:hypothetical protein AVEN_51053-1 [Araneus ventricosus]|uniref:Uncharacterized protein n=1 Tax=Araneus ventricosus TaxID=182803 RepID=A0A4Y2W7C4_ARAVE|nr:hypothetical protein AVEN_51053-1 [Araneus ventricosus]
MSEHLHQLCFKYVGRVRRKSSGLEEEKRRNEAIKDRSKRADGINLLRIRKRKEVSDRVVTAEFSAKPKIDFGIRRSLAKVLI